MTVVVNNSIAGGGGSVSASDPTILGSLNASATWAPPPGLVFSKWGAAKARSSANPARFMLNGDSNTVGEGSGSGAIGLDGARALGMMRQFCTTARFLDAGMFGEQNVSTGAEAPAVYDPRIALGTGWVVDTAPGTFGGRFLTAPGGSAGSLTFSPGVTCTSIDFWYPQAASANTAIVVMIDGLQVDTFNQAGASAYLKRSYTVTPGVHNISVSGGATGTLFVSGFVVYNGGSAVGLHGGWCAGKTADMGGVSNPWSNQNAAVALQPDFVMYYCTINDSKVPTALATVYSQVEAYVSALSPIADGVLVTGYPSSTAGTTSGVLDQYANALRRIANDYGWAYYDARAVLKSSNTGALNAGLRYDNDHPNLTGHQLYANSIYAKLASVGF